MNCKCVNCLFFKRKIDFANIEGKKKLFSGCSCFVRMMRFVFLRLGLADQQMMEGGPFYGNAINRV